MSVHSILPLQGAADAGTVSIHYIRRRLGRIDFKDRRIVQYVTLLVRDKGFPPPLPDMVRGHLVEDVTMKSQWLRNAVDAWLNDFLPPDNAISVDNAAKDAAAHEMDQAAACLGNFRLIRGGRG
ncbi:hypothetical protein [Novosphingobium guangzhouense]|uniref:Uncharacterized protein n=1 Tax=Novosphingobium guangzhouense TaxID=1850347 RepID=A0A2K2G463_9SPHN|nr:hypothetical protein [Novosphingobium guangzhouense]PNU05824.1 hypothetical protein A8V01_14765 [Novosphingobium guangzhouense]